MPHAELVFKSKRQADKLHQVFIERYGLADGNKKFEEISKRSPKFNDLPDNVTPKVKAPLKRGNISRRFNRRWRGV